MSCVVVISRSSSTTCMAHLQSIGVAVTQALAALLYPDPDIQSRYYGRRSQKKKTICHPFIVW